MSLRPLEGFVAVRSEGGLLPADLLQRIVGGNKDLDGLDPQRDYHLAGGERLNEAVSRSWQRLLGAWRNFRTAAQLLDPRDVGTTLTRDRWLLVLFQELGYGHLSTSKAISVEGREYPISHMWQRVPIHLVGCRVEIDKRTPGVAGAARTTPHGLVQDFLNRSPDHLWGFVSNGLRIRLLRDNARLTRQAYVEFDLETIFENELFADFGLLWLLSHQSRVEQERPEACWLERWRESATAQGTRALEKLRDGVEAALLALGRGFLSQRANAPLKAALRSGSLSTQDFYRELLRLVYRLLFLFVAEDRDVLHPRDAVVTARQRYSSHYSSRRLRERAQRTRGTGHTDLFRMFQVVVAGISTEEGASELGLPALGGLLWSAQAAAHLDVAELTNRDWLESVRALAYTSQDGVLRPVDWRNLGSTELGSVYESLLELHPEVNADAATFSLSSGAGNERKTSGSYYTPDSLVQCLLDSALDPVLDEAASKPDPERAILALKVCDPACGSGHFLIAAAHRMARRLATVRTGDEEPAPVAVRTALRDVIGRCLYGVDLNPMAAELCKVTLWLEGLEPGRPLSFLDHHIQVGNSLLGTTPELIAEDIPDNAFESIEGDDRTNCAALKKRNRLEREGQQDMLHLMVTEPRAEYLGLADQAGALDGIDDSNVAGVMEKEARFHRLVESDGYRHAHLIADAWCAVFVWKKASDGSTPGCLTTDSFRRLKSSVGALSQVEEEKVLELAASYRFFHWHLAFPEVHARLGFDVVLGNPPWEKLQTEELQFFASRNPEIASMPGAKRKAAIKELISTDPLLARHWEEQRRSDAALVGFIRNSGSYPLTGVGKFNTFALFSELSYGLMAPHGRVGCIVPSGIATDDTTKLFFGTIVEKRSLVSLFDFENRDGIFSSVHRSYKFCLLTLTGASPHRSEPMQFAFFARNVGDLKDIEKRFSLEVDEIRLLNPNTHTCPIFRFRKDAELAKAVYHRLPVFLLEGAGEGSGYEPRVWRLLNTTDDSADFVSGGEERAPDELVPVVEAKTMHQYDHRYGTFVFHGQDAEVEALTAIEKADPTRSIRARYYITDEYFRRRLGAEFHQKGWFLSARNIARSTDERTCIAAVFPRGASCEHTPYIEVRGGASAAAYLLGQFNSLVFDYLVRQKVGGTHISYFIIYQLPVLRLAVKDGPCPWWQRSHGLWDWLSPRVLELTYTAWDLASFARDSGWMGPPFRWDEERRFLLRCELDAAFFHLYLGTEEEWRRQPDALTKDFPTPRHAVDYVMETFPIVKRKDEATHGEYRTKRVVLEIYDELQQAIDTGRQFQTRLDPPPADPTLAHGSKTVIAAPAGAARVLPFRRLGRAPKRDERYTTVVPLLTLKAAAGSFGETQEVEFDEWAELSNPPKLQKGMFLAQVVGRSMEPEIRDGSFCLFRYVRPGSREGKIVLVQLHGYSDPETGGGYTVKRYHSEKVMDEDGGWRHARVILNPVNPAYKPIVLAAEDEGEVKVVAELVMVL